MAKPIRSADHSTSRKQSIFERAERFGTALREEPDDLTLTAAQNVLEGLNTPRSLTVSLLLKYGEHSQLVELECNPLHYQSAASFADDYQATCLLSKYPFLNTGIDRKAKAIARFREAEEMCRATNRRFRTLCEDPCKTDPWIRNILLRSSKKIASVLGPLDLDRVSDSFGWGPGATSAVGGSSTSAYNKFSGPLEVTANCLIMGHCCVNSIPAWANAWCQTGAFPSIPVSIPKGEFRIVKGDEIVFVPKNAKTDRAIGIPPHLNSYIQKGFGAVMRSKLKRKAGIDLDDQSINQRLAKQGSITGLLATIDLSMASDTVSSGLVRFLLPEDWYTALDSCRSKFATIRETGEVLNLHKFSAMGCGFTFELESLIFYALTASVCDALESDGPLSVYGDDLICPIECVDGLAKVLNFCGFKFNTAKSFSDGPFRESCGKDYFFGIDVRPIFIKEKLTNVESIYRMANSIRRYAHSRNSHCGCDRRLHAAWLHLYHRVPKPLRLPVSDGYGDCGFALNFDEACPSLSRLKDGWEGYLCKVLIASPVKANMVDQHAAYATLLSVVGSETPLLGQFTYRKRTHRKMARITVPHWYNFGPWL